MPLPLYRALTVSGVAFAVSLALVVADALGWLVLPQPFRGALPWVLLASMFAGIVLLSGALGNPARARRLEAEANDPPSTETPDA